MINEKSLAIIILIGGKSARFGTEKAVINLLNKPLILHQIDTLSNFDKDIFLVANSEEQIYNLRKKITFPKEVAFIVDDRELFTFPRIFKPMLGIYSGFKELDNLGFEKCFLLSCDMPLIKPSVIELLMNGIKGYDCCIPQWKNGFIEPFFAIYPVKKTYERSKWILETENYGLLNLIDENWKINYISVEDSIKPLDKNLVSLININGPIDLEKLMNLY
ncbi:MAG: molybdenum cofactor guanylyltransferase [Promethearchaeota archaeon]|nr:MAG: molybdenum cofactor guanylyltransferase [Candidatus Lokiarchaeota archaeon]